MSDFFVLGGGGHARVLIHGLQALGHTVRGYTALEDAGPVRGVPFLGSDASLVELKPQLPCQAALGIGKVIAESPRSWLVDRLLDLGFQLPALVMRQAQVHDDVTLGDGTVVLDGAIVVTGSRLGRVCIVNTNATIDHDCMLGDDVHVAPGATLSGGVEVGDRCMIGTGASLIHGVRVCANCLIGAGATVVHDIDTPGTYIGTPARRIA
ncbi:NeuD/PglB/VioB family sugar acetyltransferase [Halomonas sp. BC04]|uniref:NeuD/PglB/VioB family sugar acetyltransferase n=1 Tax=Halomonas sp. BC04 TaxID=1403540 RepID=UPI0003ED8980|nr:NeuD/PglB/VioB family sugar acetyltransferase [Halomonas sp. BC04]EWH00308.1 hexapeptide transferase [Halomonas sp. BC04]